jgi:hypothetical protein
MKRRPAFKTWTPGRALRCTGKTKSRHARAYLGEQPSPDKFYKRKSQEKHFTVRGIVSDFPALLNEREWFWLSAPWTRFVAQPRTAVWIFSARGFHRVVATTPVCSETDKRNGCQVPTMVLSEARGLSLFRVIREGLGSAVRLSVRGTSCLTSQWRLALEPECLRNLTGHRSESFQRWSGLPAPIAGGIFAL